MFKHLKNLFKLREVEENSREIGNDLKEKFFRYKKLVENNILGYDKVDVANYLLRVVIENLNFLEAVQAFESEHEVQNNLLIEEIYRRIATEVEVDIRSITIDNVHKDDIQYYTRIGKKLICQDPLKININELPILLNPWNGERIIDNLVGINEKNIFDCVRYSFNIENHYLYPMNIVVCNGGNHSQLSAKIKNQGKTIIKKVYDYSEVYSLVEFDGVNFIKSSDKSVIYLYDGYDKNILFYSGIIFELGRYILNNNYHSLRITEEKFE